MKKLQLFIFSIIILQQTLAFNILEDNASYPGCSGAASSSNTVIPTPALVGESSHGKLYQLQYGNDSLNLVILSGTAQQMGTSAGALLKQQVQQNIVNFEEYIQYNLETILEQIKVPKFLADILGSQSVQMIEQLLSILAYVTDLYTPDRFKQELKGLAQGAGVTYTQIRNFNLISELFQGAGASAAAGLWGAATQDQQLYTLRTLDWPVTTPVNENPLITIYQPTEEGSYSFANIGYAGIIGAISPISSQGISVAEKVWFLDRDGENVKIGYFGTPYQYVLRDIAQFGTNLQSVYGQLQSAKRTIRLYVGVGAQASKSYEGFLYSSNYFKAYSDTNYTSIYTQYHPQQNGVFYWNQYTQPSNNACFYEVFQQNYGQLNAQTLWQTLPSLAETGKSQIVVADLQNSIVYVAYGSSNGTFAYQKDLFQINLKQYW